MTLRENLFTALGTTMAVGLLWTAGQPGIGDTFRGAWHYAAHFGTFALLGAIWRLGLPRIAPPAMAAGVVMFAFAHEAYEIVGHGHGFELADAMVDGLGATVGILCFGVRRATPNLDDATAPAVGQGIRRIADDR